MDPRRPVIPIAVETDEDHLVLYENGTARVAAQMVLADDDIGRIRAGYVCAHCMEAQDKPFPKKCWVCGFRMAERQAEYVARAYQGSVRMGPTSSLEDELAALQELEDRERREARISAPQILIPGMW